jgi:hypothetical protein
MKQTKCCAKYETRTTVNVGANASQPSGAGGRGDDLLHIWNAMRGPNSEKRNNKADVAADLRKRIEAQGV